MIFNMIFILCTFQISEAVLFPLSPHIATPKILQVTSCPESSECTAPCAKGCHLSCGNEGSLRKMGHVRRVNKPNMAIFSGREPVRLAPILELAKW